MKLSMQIKYNSTDKLKAVTANFGMYIYPVHVDVKFKPVKSGIVSYGVIGNVHDLYIQSKPDVDNECYFYTWLQL